MEEKKSNIKTVVDTVEDTTETTGDAVRDIKGRTFFVGDAVLNEVDEKFVQLNAEYFAEYGEELEKNREYYPTLFRAIDWNQVRVELGIDDE